MESISQELLPSDAKSLTNCWFIICRSLVQLSHNNQQHCELNFPSYYGFPFFKTQESTIIVITNISTLNASVLGFFLSIELIEELKLVSIWLGNMR